MSLDFFTSLQLKRVLCILLRTPAIFSLNAFMRNTSIGTWLFFDSQPVLREDAFDFSKDVHYYFNGTGFYRLPDVPKLPFNLFAFRLLEFLVLLCTSLFPAEMLVKTYKFFTASAILIFFIHTNSCFLKFRRDEYLSHTMDFRVHFFILTCYCIIFISVRFINYPSFLNVMVLSIFVSPSICNFDPNLRNALRAEDIALISALLISLFFTANALCFSLEFSDLTRQSLITMRENVNTYDGLALLAMEWRRLKVPSVFCSFWLLRFFAHFLQELNFSMKDYNWWNLRINVEDYMESGKTLLANGCDGIVPVLGMAGVVAWITHFLCTAVHTFVKGNDEDRTRYGAVSAVLFIILALQTGLTTLEPEERLVCLCRNVCLVFVAILNFNQATVNTVLTFLSIRRSNSVELHTRVFLVCAVLIAIPASLVYYLWTYHGISTWVLAITAHSIEVIVKVVISIVLYALLMIDARRTVEWRNFDNHVFYVKSSGKIIEFLSGVFLFFNGTWILVYEAWGSLRAFLTCIHAYCNIWKQSIKGWRTLEQRKATGIKVDSFPEATPAQLEILDDVCCFCYQSMSTARITTCRHYLHDSCLRKWLNIRGTCPACHTRLVEDVRTRHAN